MTHKQFSSKGDPALLKAFSDLGIDAACVSKKGVKQLQNIMLSHKEFSKKGGQARSAKLTPERRKEIAAMGGKARKKKGRKG